MENMYRCDKCGNHLPSETGDGLICGACNSNIFTLITEENKTKLPIPPEFMIYADIDPDVCNDAPGLCPCGDFITHPVTEPCDVNNDEVEKQTRTWECQCTTASCRCGAYVAHRVDEPCTAKGI
jgi:DNA-directed RNA polymerase subunit RPC12/RpoP